MLSWGFQAKNIYDNYGENKQISNSFSPNNDESYIFNMRYFDDVKNMMNEFNLNVLHYVATDGIGRIIKNDIEQMSDEEYGLYINYHLSICERGDLIGYSGHILSIVQK